MDPQETVGRYLAAFNETDPVARKALLQELYGAQSTYTDPHVHACGPEEIDAFIAQTQERFPGVSFRLGSPVDAHHEQARFRWQAGPDEDPARFAGFDVIVTDGPRIRSVYGFSEPAPAA